MGKKKEKQSSSGVSEDAKPPPSKKAKVEDSDTETQETSSHKKGMLSCGYTEMGVGEPVPDSYRILI